MKQQMSGRVSDSPFLDNRDRLFENSKGFVIYDKCPVSRGHCLIVPRRVYSNYFDSTEEEREALNQLVFETKSFLDEKYQPSGYQLQLRRPQNLKLEFLKYYLKGLTGMYTESHTG